jgi:hypothetical protein
MHGGVKTVGQLGGSHSSADRADMVGVDYCLFGFNSAISTTVCAPLAFCQTRLRTGCSRTRGLVPTL